MKVENRQCKLCELHRKSDVVCVGGNGPWRAPIMVVSEGPDRFVMENQFTMGKVLRTALEESGINPNIVFSTYAVRCCTFGNTPSNSQFTMCRGYLLKEIEAIDPAAIICMGKTTLLGFFPNHDKDIKDTQFYVGDWKKKPVYVTYHPSAVSRNSLLQPLVSEVFRKVRIETERRLSCKLR